MEEIRLVSELLKHPTVAGFLALFIMLTAAVIFWLIRSNSKLSEALIKSADDESEAVKSRDKQIERLITTIVDGQKELSGNIKENTEATREFMKLLGDNRSQIDKHDEDSIGRTNQLKTAVNQVGINVADVGRQLQQKVDEIIAGVKLNVSTGNSKLEKLLKDILAKLETLSTSEQVEEIKSSVQELQTTLSSIQSGMSQIEALVKPVVKPFEPDEPKTIETKVSE